MPHNNLDQVRAGHALAAAQPADRTTPGFDRSDVQKLPALVINNGLVAAAAFTLDSAQRVGMKKVMDKLADHLAQRGILSHGTNTALAMITDLTTGAHNRPLDLQRATMEALAYLGYAKRFAQ